MSTVASNMDEFFMFFDAKPSPTPAPIFFLNPFGWVAHESHKLSNAFIGFVVTWSMIILAVRLLPVVGPLVTSCIERTILYCIGHRKEIAADLIDLTEDVAEVVNDVIHGTMKHVSAAGAPTPVSDLSSDVEEEIKSSKTGEDKSKTA